MVLFSQVVSTLLSEEEQSLLLSCFHPKTVSYKGNCVWLYGSADSVLSAWNPTSVVTLFPWPVPLSLKVIYHTIPHELCRCGVKGVDGLHSFFSTHSAKKVTVCFSSSVCSDRRC